MLDSGYVTAPVTVLIVDDNRDFAENMAELARLQSLRPFIATGLKDALDRMRKEPVDVAIVDHRLPDGTGTDLLIQAKEVLPDLVTIFVTGFASSDTTAKALNVGAFAFVTKDSEPELFLDAMNRAAQNAMLRRENRRLRATQHAILAGIPDQLLLVDDRLTVVSANRRHADFCPSGTEDVPLPAPLSELLSERVRDRYDWEGLVRRARQEQMQLEPNLIVRDPVEGSRIYTIRCIPVAEDPVRLALIRISDMTSQIDLDRRISESESLARVGRMVAIIAHEIRNPITGIRALAQLLQKEHPESSSARESIDEILSLADRMTATLMDLLQYSKPRELSEMPVKMGDLATDLVREGRRWPSCEGRTLKYQENTEEDLLVLGGRDRLFSAFSNLIDNALQASPEGGMVIVSLGGDTGECRISVEDSGPGIDSADHLRVFEPFFSKRDGGTGLGLSIVKSAVEEHGGSISVGRSSLLGGGLFEVRLPVMQAGSAEGQ
ncbi:MAG: hybrid sensor histidine kinase/response regulator [Planctomycetota bacterium]